MPQLNFLALGLGIYKEVNPGCHDLKEGTKCYNLKGTGNLVSKDKNVYILTVAHLFTQTEEEEYVLSNRSDMTIPFKHKITPKELNSSVDATMIKIGEIDPQTNDLIVKTNSTFQGKVHLHQ